jgi:hypothetical protein
MVAFTEKLLGETCQRTGKAPKTGLVYRCGRALPQGQQPHLRQAG